MLDTVMQGFAAYRAFAPRGWDPPPALLEHARIAERLERPDAWCVVAEAGGRPAGHVGLHAAEPAVAHLWMLFVREPWWGSGLATRLLALATAEARRRGDAAMRLFTPAAHARARAFYEREGWSLSRAAEFDPLFGLELVEYRRAL